MTTQNLSTLSSGELAGIYNNAAVALKRQPVKRFKDRATAQRRTTAILANLAVANNSGIDTAPVAPAPKKKVAAKPAAPKKKAVAKKPAAPKKERKKRGMRFVFPFHGADHLRSLRDSETLRGQCVDLLKGGAKFDKVEALVERFDASKGRPSKFVERRAYELVRIMHYYLGYGISHKDGEIKLHTREAG